MSENGRRQGFFMTSNAVFELMPVIKPTGFAVYSYLLRLADAEGHCWPTQGAIADAVGISDRQVRTVLNTLIEVGLIAIGRRDEDGIDRRGTLYTILEYRKSASAICPEYRKSTSGSLGEYRKSASAYTGSGLPLNTGSPLPLDKYPCDQDPEKKTASPLPGSLSELDPDPPTTEELFLRKPDPAAVDGLGLTLAQRAAANGIAQRITGGLSGPAWNDWAVWQRLFGDGLTPDAAHSAVEAVIARERGKGNKTPAHLGYYVGALEDAVRAAKTSAAATFGADAALAEVFRRRAERQTANAL